MWNARKLSIRFTEGETVEPNMQHALERIIAEANELYPTREVKSYYERQSAYMRQAEFMIRELRFEIGRAPVILEALVFKSDEKTQ